MNLYEVVVHKIPSQSTIAEEALSIALDASQWMPYYNFMAKPVPAEVTQKDPFLKWLGERYNFIAGVIKSDPFSVYDWHIDSRRGVGINMLLSFNGFSMCLFTTHDEQIVRPILPMQYTPNEYYVFNTQQKHMVLNFDQPRYLFTIEFELDKDGLSYDELVNDIKENWGKHETT